MVTTPKDPISAESIPADGEVWPDLLTPDTGLSLASPGEDPPWGLLAGLLAWAASVVLLVAMVAMFTLPYIVCCFHGSNNDALKQFLTTDKTAILVQLVSTLPAHLLTLAVAWAVVTGFGARRFFPTLKWSWNGILRFWPSAGLAIVLYVVGVGITRLVPHTDTQIDLIVLSSRAAAYTVAFLAVVTAPLVEEIIYRGVLYAPLEKRAGKVWAVIGVLSLFTAVHVPQYWPNFGVIAAVGVLSIALTLVRALTGRLLPCFVIHVVFNGIQAVLIVLEPYLFGPELSSPQKAFIVGAVLKLRFLLLQ